MARPGSTTSHPIQTLRETTQSLEAAILVCLAKPTKKAVHRLRTSTRRIEAQLELLSTLSHLPAHKQQKSKALRLLKKLRRAAGRVRDLDVQRDLIRDEAAAKKHPTAKLRKEARDLRRILKQKRDQEADGLHDLLQDHLTQLPRVFEKLLDALASAESISLTQTQLTRLVQTWYAKHSGSNHDGRPPEDPAQLHQIRKQAKLARYLAESAPETATSARRLATKFENLQVAGGEWHDWLLLTGVASGELGKSAQLPQRFTAHADRSLGAYKRRLRYKI